MATFGNVPGFARQRNRIQYVRDIPASAFQKLCRLLDVVESSDMNWKTLAADLGFTNDEIAVFGLETCRPSSSPSNKMLRTWDYMNHTVLELYNGLFRMKHGRAMALIKDYVDEREHYKIEVCRGVIPETTVQIQPRQNRPFQGIDPSHLPGPPLPHMPSENMYPQDPHEYYSSNPHRPVDRASENVYRVSENACRIPESSWSNPHAQNGSWSQPPDPHQQYKKPVDANFMFPNMDTRCNKQLMSPDILHRYRQDTSSDNQSTKSNTTKMTLTAFSFLNSFQHEKIVEATNGFSDQFKRGEGAFGTVYYAMIDYSPFAVKRLKQKSEDGYDADNFACSDYLKEIPALLRYRHANIVPLLGYSYDGPLPCLLYEYCENGSLEDNLLGRDGRKPLDWPIRHSIVLGAAVGLSFLHSAQPDKPLIHGDIKSANILLGKDFIPKIGDFGLARHGPSGNKLYTIMNTAQAHGTLAYLPLEYKRNRKLSTKVDVYSFGVVLLEVLTGQRAFDEKREPRNHQHVTELVEHVKDTHKPEVATEKLKDIKCQTWPWDLAAELMDISSECTITKFQKRPEMNVVAEKLHELNNKVKHRQHIRNKDDQRCKFEMQTQSPMTSQVTIKPTMTDIRFANLKTDDQMQSTCHHRTLESQKLQKKMEGLYIGMHGDDTHDLNTVGDRVDTQQISLWHKEGPCQSSDSSLSTSKLFSDGYSTEATPGSSVKTPSSVPTSRAYDSSVPTTGSSFNQTASVNSEYPPQRLPHPGFPSPVGMLQSGNANFGYPQYPGVDYMPQYCDPSSNYKFQGERQEEENLRTPDSYPSVNPYTTTEIEGNLIPDPSLAPHLHSPQFLPQHFMSTPLHYQQQQQNSLQNERLASAPHQTNDAADKNFVPRSLNGVIHKPVPIQNGTNTQQNSLNVNNVPSESESKIHPSNAKPVPSLDTSVNEDHSISSLTSNTEHSLTENRDQESHLHTANNNLVLPCASVNSKSHESISLPIKCDVPNSSQNDGTRAVSLPIASG